MRKLILCLLVATSTVSIFAQKGLHIGGNIGVNSVWILNQNNYGFSEMDYELKFGAIAGLAGGYNFTPNAGIELQLNYAMLGQNYFDVIRDFGPIDSVTGKPDKTDTYRYVKMSYLQVPVLFRYQTTKEKKDKVEFHVMAGPAVGLLLSADQSYEADVDGNGSVELLDYAIAPESAVDAFNATDPVEEPEEYFSSMDIGLQLDLGVDIYVSDELYVTPALKTYYGITDINSEPTREIDGYTASHNAFVGISVGIHYIKMEKAKKK
jgi:opacity protein-like surface antigen